MFSGEIEVNTVAVARASADEQRDRDLALFPRDLHICCIDDSAPARRLLHFNITKWGRTDNVHIYGQEPSEADTFVEKCLMHGDIAILDQNLEYGGESSLLGTGSTLPFVCLCMCVCPAAKER